MSICWTCMPLCDWQVFISSWFSFWIEVKRFTEIVWWFSQKKDGKTKLNWIKFVCIINLDMNNVITRYEAQCSHLQIGRFIQHILFIPMYAHRNVFAKIQIDCLSCKKKSYFARANVDSSYSHEKLKFNRKHGESDKTHVRWIFQ